MFWSIAIISFKAKEANKQRAILKYKLIDTSDETNIIKEDTNKFICRIQAALKETLDDSPRALLQLHIDIPRLEIFRGVIWQLMNVAKMRLKG